ncbi:MAG: ribbon-helix-helix domain-containing protein [Candidatus Accumulibacter sp.]|nr:ribbon-helix-helix domain-containing protein [Accumulibacter sp.]
MTTQALQVTPPTTEPKSIRASVSFPSDLYETLEKIARDKKVSVAWVVRDASEKYVNEQWPLLAGKE